MGIMDEYVKMFTEKAEAVSAIVSQVETPQQAFEYVVDFCVRKEACQLLPAGCERDLSHKAADLCDVKQDKIIAAPGLSEEQFGQLEALCKEKGIVLIHEGLRNHLAGMDIGFTFVEHGIANTGTLVLNSGSEEIRLATMISEVHVAVLPISKIVKDSYDLEEELTKSMSSPPNYLAFITGASRTADIERVLAIGVHGPLELHILLWKDK